MRIALIFAVMWSWCGFVTPKGELRQKGRCPTTWRALRVPGEVWGGAVQRYFLALEEGVNLLPGFSPELQGVYSETDADGMKRLYGYVLK
ncbi:Orn/Lys/Arg family decarboxylase [Escherichia coli]